MVARGGEPREVGVKTREASKRQWNRLAHEKYRSQEWNKIYDLLPSLRM